MTEQAGTRMQDNPPLLTLHDVVAIVDHVNRHGFATVGPVIDADTVREGVTRLDAISRRHDLRSAGVVTMEPEAPEAASRKINDVAQVDPFFLDIVRRFDVVKLMETALGPNIKLHTSIAWLKPAAAGSAKDAHQDLATWRHLVDASVLTLWLAFDDAAIHNGCMHYVDGSHDEPKLRVHEHGASYSTPGFTPQPGLTVACPVSAGYGTLHAGGTIHWTPPNTTGAPRRAVSYSFVAANTRVSPRYPQLVNSFPSITGRSFPGCV